MSDVSVDAVDPAEHHDALSALLEAYLRQTELEKAEHGLSTFGVGDVLPQTYAAEVRDPGDAFRGSVVLLARVDGHAAGMAVVKPVSVGGGSEVKRLWVDPAFRGHGVGGRLLEAAAALGLPLRLSVWSWREPAIRLYERLGFRRAPSWEERPDLVCLVRRAD